MRVQLDLRKLQEIDGDIQNIANRILGKLATDVEAEAKQSMEGQGGGRIYGNHQASAPGEPPAVDTGNLKNSIVTRQTGRLAWQVNVGAFYGAYLEFGTVKMQARPFLLPAFERVIQNIPADLLEKEIK